MGLGCLHHTIQTIQPDTDQTKSRTGSSSQRALKGVRLVFGILVSAAPSFSKFKHLKYVELAHEKSMTTEGKD